MADEVDFQIAPASEPVTETKQRRRPRAATKPKAEAVASTATAEDTGETKPRRRRPRAAAEKAETAAVTETVAAA